jgi:predicted nuclease of predicted toxin-antitoxin system
VRFKLDENIGRRGIAAFEAEGHDVSSIHLQKLEGSPDSVVYEVCRAEQRVLVTLDLDFANPLVFDPRRTAGVAVLRLSRNPEPSELAVATHRLLVSLRYQSINGSLWVVRPERIRVWTPTDRLDGDA